MSQKTNTKNSSERPGSKLVCCMYCAHAGLHQYDNNPILADCHAQPMISEKFPYQVEIASCMRKCALYKKALQVPEIEHRTHRAA